VTTSLGVYGLKYEAPEPYQKHRRNRAALTARWRIPSAPVFRFWMQKTRVGLSPPLSQKELARLASLHPLTVHYIERGTKEPTLEVAHRIWLVLWSLKHERVRFSGQRIGGP